LSGVTEPSSELGIVGGNTSVSFGLKENTTGFYNTAVSIAFDLGESSGNNNLDNNFLYELDVLLKNSDAEQSLGLIGHYGVLTNQGNVVLSEPRLYWGLALIENSGIGSGVSYNSSKKIFPDYAKVGESGNIIPDTNVPYALGWSLSPFATRAKLSVDHIFTQQTPLLHFSSNYQSSSNVIKSVLREVKEIDVEGNIYSYYLEYYANGNLLGVYQ
jgi:hypothetical protein